MTLQSPNLDDRNFQQLLDEAKHIIRTECPQWTDLSPGDPGIVLLELFAHLTETMIYRLNRLPEKAYVEFLRLIGVKLSPPVAARVTLTFSLRNPLDKPVEVPRGTRVTLARSGGSEPAPMFVVLKAASIPAGRTSVDAVAYHCELIEAEDAGKGTGVSGFSVSARRPPIVAATSEDLELVVGVEATPAELTDRMRAREYDGQAYALWREVDDFSDLLGRRLVYVADRMTGTVTFAPALQRLDEEGQLEQDPQALAVVPKADRQVRLWYCTGGGLAGNVAANTLTTLKDPIPGVLVTNPEPATGGRDAETMENALMRGPQELHSLQRAVTARDFELLATRSSGTVASSGAVARAKAFTRASVWKHAEPGTIEVLLVPFIPDNQRPDGRVTEEALKAHETSGTLANVQRSLDERRPLGTTCLVNWVRYKEVRVEARAVVHRGENAEAVEARVLKRLHQSINPLPSDLPSAGWPFRQPLRASNVYDIMLAEPGVNYVDNVSLLVDEVPDTENSSLAVDRFQPHTWYATTRSKLFRSMDSGDGWELVEQFADNERTYRIRTNPFKAGQAALVTNLPSPTDAQVMVGSRVYVSDDCGETWRRVAELPESRVRDVAWVPRQLDPVLIVASDSGLFELSLQPDASLVPISVDASRPKMGFYAVTSAVGIRGTIFVAAAAQQSNGVFLSAKGGQSKTFDIIRLKGDDIRVLEIQKDDVRTFLWAGITLIGNETAKPGEEAPGGTIRWELQDDAPPGNGTNMRKNWAGLSCRGLAFTRDTAFAATHDKGVLWLNLNKGDQATWNHPIIESGLKLGDTRVDFQSVDALAADPEDNVVMAGCAAGIYRSQDNGTSYQPCSGKVFQDKITLPDTWLFVSGEHRIDVVSEDESS